MSLILNELKIANKLVTTSGGSIGIGKSSPTAPLDVNGIALISGSLSISGSANSLIFDAHSSAFLGRYALLPGRFSVGTLSSGYPEIGYNFSPANGVYTKLVGDTAWRIGFGNSNLMLFSYAASGTGTFSWTNAMAINMSGNVGIGTTSPGAKLAVNGTLDVSGTTTLSSIVTTSATEALRINQINGYISIYNTAGDTRTGYLQGNAASSVILAAENSSILQFNVANSERMRINTNGNVGIGNTSPSYLLDVNGTSRIGNKVRISSISKTLGGTANDTSAIGYISNNGTGKSVKIKVMGHNCGVINVLEFVCNEITYVGVTTNWLELPLSQHSQAYAGQQVYTVDVYRQNIGSTSDPLYFRLRNKPGNCSSNSVSVELEFDGSCTFTELTNQTTTATSFNSSTAPAGGVVDGYYGNVSYQFPVTNGNGWQSAQGGLYIINGGNVGINKTAPTAKLDVNGDTKLTGSLLVTGSMTIAGDLIPAEDRRYSLGSSTRRWNDLYVISSSISQITESLMTISNEYTLAVVNGNRVAGFKIAINNQTSSFVIQADKFAVVNTSGVNPISPFIIENNIVYINSASIKNLTADNIAANTITADRIKANTITANEISASAITADRIRANTITANEISASAITTDKLAANSITATKISASAIITTHLSASIIDADKIQSNAIITTHLSASAITTAKIAADAITATQISASAITTSKIAADAIVSSHISASAITSTKIAADAVTAAQISASAITSAKIATDAITATHISASVITTSKIAADAITSTQISASAIIASKIATDAITSTHISASAITTNKLAANAVTAAKIAAGTITATEISASAITGDRIAANTITATQISASAITTDKLNANAVTAAKIAAGTITANEISASAITSAKIAAGAITADMITTGTMNAARIGVGTLTGITISGNTISGNTITGGSLNIGSGVFQVASSGNITSTGGTIAGWTIAATTLTGGSTTLNSDGTITCANLTANTAGSIGGWTIGASTLTGGSTTLNSNGTITCANLTANTAGSIGGWTIGASTLTGGSTTLNSNGTITCANLTANTAGSIGGWTIGATTLTGGNLTINSAGKITGPGGFEIDGSTSQVTIKTGGSYSATLTGGSANAALIFNGTSLSGNGSSFTFGAAVNGPSFNATSSRRYKKNIVEFKSGLSIIEKLRPVTFDWKNKNIKNEIGLIAEEVNKVLPNIVHKNEKGKVESLDYSKLAPVLLAAIKELTEEIKELKSRINKLENR